MRQYQKDRLKYTAIKAQIYIGVFGLLLGLVLSGTKAETITGICINAALGMLVFIISIGYLFFIINKYRLDETEEDREE